MKEKDFIKYWLLAFDKYSLGVTAVVNFNFCSINQWIFLAFKRSFYWFNYLPFVLGLDGSNEMFVFAIHDSQSGTFLNFKLIQLSADEKNSPREWGMTQKLIIVNKQ